MSELLASLQTCFGFQEFRPGQEEAIGALLAGEHTVVVMPTGAGKSLIYQLAALHRPGLAPVISPLIALMKDQVDSLVRCGLLATYINSTLTADEQAERLDALSRGAYRLVYVSPERLRNVAFAEALRRTTVGLLAVDEAHCISQWGHDFRPDYLHIATARHALGEPLTVALTATATPRVQADIIRLLGLPAARRIVTGFNRPNLAFEVRYTAEPAAKLAALQELLAGLAGDAAIVYVGTRRDAEEVADFVREVCRLRAEFYHAGLDAETRTRVQNAFLNIGPQPPPLSSDSQFLAVENRSNPYQAHLGGLTAESPQGDFAEVAATSSCRAETPPLQVVVATNAFGMGIDRPDVRLVAHFAMPGTLEAYYQEAGRAGRDGLPARAVLLYSPKDRALQEWFIENDAPAADEVRLLYDVICAKGDPFPHPSPAKGGEASPSPAGKGARGSGAAWFTLEDLSLATGLPEVKLRVGLAQLEAAGSLERLGDAGPRMLLRVGPWHAEAMAETGAQVEARRRHRREQLAQMVAYAESNACRRRILLDHFGDRSPAQAAVCCDNCQQRANAATQAQPAIPSAPLEAGSPAQTALVILDAVRRLKWEIGKEKPAQLLHGSQAKEMRMYSYDRSPYYGRLAVFSKGEIGGLIDQLIRWGYLKVVGGEMPVLKLTPKAEVALRERAAIPLHLPRPIDPQRVAMKQAERAAGGTVALTAQLFGQGLTPAEIAARRGLTENTILGHLAELIADGVVPLSAVVPDEIVAQIEAAIAQVGSTAQLTPIKQLLPEAISYGQIRCVVARPHPFSPSPERARSGGKGGGWGVGR
ncbi:MAG: RecQ family ATP-dependent DNA helicase [Anaerolineae bacterium]